MFEWFQNSNGNFVHVFSEGDLMTVYKNEQNGLWKGIYDGNLLIGSYATAEEAQEAMEQYINGASNLVMPLNRFGRSKKDANYYQSSKNGIHKAKQAKSGKWFITRNGVILKNLWLGSEEEAINKIRQLSQ